MVRFIYFSCIYTFYFLHSDVWVLYFSSDTNILLSSLYWPVRKYNIQFSRTEERRHGEKRRDQRHYTMRSIEIYDCDDDRQEYHYNIINTAIIKRARTLARLNNTNIYYTGWFVKRAHSPPALFTLIMHFEF